MAQAKAVARPFRGGLTLTSVSLAAGAAVFWLVIHLGRNALPGGVGRLKELGRPVPSGSGTGHTVYAGNGSAVALLTFLGRVACVARPGASKRAQERLVRAGLEDTVTPQVFLGWQVVSALCGLYLGIIMGLWAEGRWAWFRPIPWMLLGFKLPDVWLSQRSEVRQRRILADFPFLLDLLVVCASAGLNLRRSLEALAGFRAGPLAAEVQRAIQEIEVGRSPAQALRSLADRTGLSQISAFVSTVIQAEAMGTPVARTFAAQAEAARTQSRQRLEAQISALPTKLTMVTILFDLPAIFGLTVLPNVLRFISSGW